MSIPTAPAIACAYWQRDGKLRTSFHSKTLHTAGKLQAASAQRN